MRWVRTHWLFAHKLSCKGSYVTKPSRLNPVLPVQFFMLRASDEAAEGGTGTDCLQDGRNPTTSNVDEGSEAAGWACRETRIQPRQMRVKQQTRCL